MKPLTKQLLSDLLVDFECHLATLRLKGQEKQTLRRAYKRTVKARLSEYELLLPVPKRAYNLTWRGRAALRAGMAKTRAKAAGYDV